MFACRGGSFTLDKRGNEKAMSRSPPHVLGDSSLSEVGCQEAAFPLNSHRVQVSRIFY